MKILIADDDPSIRKQLEISLVKWGYDVIGFSDGHAAWQHIQSKESPSLLILDWDMPGISGTEICKSVRELKIEPSPYIILLTAKDNVEDIAEGLDSGADDYITKPFFPHELNARLKAGVRVLKLQEQLMDSRDRLEVEATHDFLTGIFNRRAIIESLQTEIDRSYRESKSLSIALFDLDNFKAINDTYGHLAGDEILCETTKKINSAMRPYDSFGRYGGEEFLLVLPNCDFDNAKHISERIRKLISDNSIETTEGMIKVTISVGVCVLRGGKQFDVDSIIKVADESLYKAKDNGRNCIEISIVE